MFERFRPQKSVPEGSLRQAPELAYVGKEGVKVQRSDYSVDEHGWVVASATAGMIRLWQIDPNGPNRLAEKTVDAETFLLWQLIGTDVSVRRPDGAFERDWVLYRATPGESDVVVRKIDAAGNRLEEHVSRADFLTWQQK